MAFMESLRSRFASELQSHQIDDDYTEPPRRSVQSNYLVRSSVLISPPAESAPFVYDPNEAVPSYETSQMLHERLHHRTTPHEPAGTPRESSVGPETLSSNSSNSGTPLATPGSTTPPPATRDTRLSLKQLGLKFLNARQHFALALSRDVSLIPPLIGLVQSWKRMFVDQNITSSRLNESLTRARVSEHFLTGMWCIVSAYLSYSVLDGLIIRWIVIYLTPAAIVRVLCMSTIMITIEQYLVATFSANGYQYGLHTWILISCALTLTFIGQNFVTSNLDLKKGGRQRARFFDFYNIAVFAVVPVGLASFITMIGLLRSLLIVRIDIDQMKLSLSN